MFIEFEIRTEDFVSTEKCPKVLVNINFVEYILYTGNRGCRIGLAGEKFDLRNSYEEVCKDLQNCLG